MLAVFVTDLMVTPFCRNFPSIFPLFHNLCWSNNLCCLDCTVLFIPIGNICSYLHLYSACPLEYRCTYGTLWLFRCSAYLGRGSFDNQCILCHRGRDCRERGFFGGSLSLPNIAGCVDWPFLIHSSLGSEFKYRISTCVYWIVAKFVFYFFVSCGKGGFQITSLLSANWKQDLFLFLIWLPKMAQLKPVTTLIYLKMYYVRFAKMLREK